MIPDLEESQPDTARYTTQGWSRLCRLIAESRPPRVRYSRPLCNAKGGGRFIVTMGRVRFYGMKGLYFINGDN